MNLKVLLTVGIFISFPFLINSQTHTIDFLNYKFKYIDSNYKIHIDSATFDSAVVKYSFYKNRITKYQDSIAVVVMAELNDWQACNSAKVQLGFSWLRASYYCWMTVDEVKALSKSLGYNHPWYIYKAIMNPDNKSEKIQKLIKTINTKLHNTNPEIQTDGLTRKQFFMLALKYNPVRIEDEKKSKLTEAYQQRHNILDSTKIGIGCDKVDCCQKPVITTKQVTEKEKALY